MTKKKSTLTLKESWNVRGKFKGDNQPVELKIQGINTKGTPAEVTINMQWWTIPHLAAELWKVFNEKQQAEARQNKSIREALTNIKVA